MTNKCVFIVNIFSGQKNPSFNVPPSLFKEFTSLVEQQQEIKVASLDEGLGSVSFVLHNFDKFIFLQTKVFKVELLGKNRYYKSNLNIMQKALKVFIELDQKKEFSHLYALIEKQLR